MGQVAEAEVRIMNATFSGSNILDLKGLQLTTEELAGLIPSMKQIHDLTVLNLSENNLPTLPSEIGDLDQLTVLEVSESGLTSLPPEIGKLSRLTSLVLPDNKLWTLPPEFENLSKLEEFEISNNEFRIFPKEICSLGHLQTLLAANNTFDSIPPEIATPYMLSTLDLSSNRLTSLPDELGNLPILHELYLGNNQLSAVPEKLANVNLQTLGLQNNPLSEETMHWLFASFRYGVVETNMAANEVEIPIERVLDKLFSGESAEILSKINSLTAGSFTIGEGYTQRERNCKQVVTEFLGKLPITGSYAEEVYIPTAKGMLEIALNTDSDESEFTLQKMATALGDCGTPVKELLTQVFVGTLLKDIEDPTEDMPDLVIGMAMQHEITTKLKELLNENETIEQVQGLMNALFLAGAENNPDNPLKIEGTRPRLPSKTNYVEYAFDQVTHRVAVACAKLCCKTNPNGALLRNQQDRYVLDPNKLKNIKEVFLASHGFLSNREKLIKDFGKKLGEALQTHGPELMSKYYEEPDVVPLLDNQAQEAELREQIRDVEDDEIMEIVERSLSEKIDLIKELQKKHAPATAPNLAQLTTPLNLSAMPTKRKSETNLSAGNTPSQRPPRRNSM